MRFVAGSSLDEGDGAQRRGITAPLGTQKSEETILYEAQLHPEATSVRGQYCTTVTLDGRTLVWESDVEVRSHLQNFYYTNVRRLLKDGSVLREKTWRDTIPRDQQ